MAKSIARAVARLQSYVPRYGTTWLGGDQYVGVVFKLTSDGNGHWSEAVLHSFEISDGDGPIGGLVWDSSHSNFLRYHDDG